jgi:CheY-like chemotaxis protein
MEQVILNLVVNARHAMPRGGKLVVATEHIHLTAYDSKVIPEARPGDFICLTVSDTGSGIDAPTLEHIFEPFFTTKGPSKGSGLGLSVVYGIVQQHKGWINVTSQPGEGTTFKVYLPAFSGSTHETTDKSIPLNKLQGQGEKILLIEDEDGVRKFAADTLLRNGYKVYEAANAKQALDCFAREDGRFDAVFTDVVLPDLGGGELTEQLLSRVPDLRVLITSGHTFESLEVDDMINAGYPFLQKPYNVPSLLQSIKSVLSETKHK